MRVWAGFGLLLFASTWKLWTPQTDFPQIPFLESLIDVPGWVDWIALAIVGVSLLVCLGFQFSNRTKWALGTFALASAVLIALNQHRLQPWAYQFLIFAIIIATTNEKSAMKWMRWIVISIYIYSAISKFDYQFVHTVGDQMVQALASLVGADATHWPNEIKNGIALSFPTLELAVGIGLAFGRTRPFAVTGSIGMHLMLLLVLLYQQQSPGVLVWNLFFIAQAILLFRIGKTSESSSCREPTVQSYPLSLISNWVAAFVIAFPLTQPFGICDHWPAWQVYAPRTSRAERLAPRFKLTYQWYDPATWSLTELRVPVYPQARFQFAVALATLQESTNGRETGLIEVFAESDRFAGRRQSDILSGDQIQMHAEEYRLNIKPRIFWFDEPARQARMQRFKQRERERLNQTLLDANRFP